MGKLTENIKGTINEVVGGLKQESDRPEDKAEGKVQELKGKAQKVKGKVEGALGNDI
ncbi:MAG: CsbD family protein [Erythrobacter sp.]